jgi:hypothetical protein
MVQAMAVTKPAPDAEPEVLVVDAVQRDLAALALVDPELARSALAVTALKLAADLDWPRTSPTARSMVARAMLDILDRLRELSPAAETSDALDQLTVRRAARLAG